MSEFDRDDRISAAVEGLDRQQSTDSLVSMLDEMSPEDALQTIREIAGSDPGADALEMKGMGLDLEIVDDEVRITYPGEIMGESTRGSSTPIGNNFEVIGNVEGEGFNRSSFADGERGSRLSAAQEAAGLKR